MAKSFISNLFGRKPKPDSQPEDADQQTASVDAPNTAPTTDEALADEPISEQLAQAADVGTNPPIESPEKHDTADADAQSNQQPEKKGWLSRLRNGLNKSSSRISDGVTSIFTKRKLDDDTIEELEDLLISSDLGVAAAGRITATLAREKFDKEISSADVRAAMAAEITSVLSPLEKPLEVQRASTPHVILMIGVNGAGKTTTCGKLARKFQDEGRSVLLVAGDTFRAAAVEQLAAWGERTKTPVLTAPVGADSAGLAYDAIEKARAENHDIVMIDTAGRLQNKSALMDELAKIVRVIKKHDEHAPHDVVLVLDATVGQNAITQAQAFSDIAGVTGLVMTKLDGTARGGVLVALADKFSLPIHFIGVGESLEDLQRFDASAFARALAGLEQT